jgi:hypothetical protein
MGFENRRFDRASTPFELECRSAGGQAALWERAMTRDFGAGGVAFQSDAQFARDELLEVRFSLPNTGAPLVVRGRVVRVDARDAGGREYGVAFEDPTPDQQAQIDELVQFLRKKPNTP